ncbi:MAG TPA: guanylate kinase [Deltaproteobacteria bacterium]|nr:guanylate kinase [Deltaproteobacteria bacterium]OQC29567.1 MAG: Guanylate kinase [Deltaproteobacteria bacterium ADurb.Bin072]HRW80043.1 guanylate kinase [Desulfomonilia bacterium]NMD39683.1 guanylate kinase [Deltaproteobacteria bacterium]HNQ84511.1 guanylate kinase [Deltaproteobacteria bacterium]
MRIFVSGPSGVGKSTIIKEIVKRKTDIVLSVSYTTRAPRPCEQDGIDYFFISRPVFERMIRSDAFLEWAQVHENLYGTSLAWIEREERQGHHVLFDIDVQGVIQAKEKGSPGCFILILPPSMDELERRLSERGTEDPQALILRTQNAKNELSNWALYDYLVVNESLEQCIDDIATIIDAYRSSREVVIGELPWLKAIA